MAQSRLGKLQELKNTGARQQVTSDRKLNEMYISNYKQSSFYTGDEKDVQQDARYFYQAQHPERYAGYYDKQWQNTFDALQSLRTGDAQSYDSGWQSSFEKMQERLNKLRDQSKKWASNVERFFDDPSSVRKWSQSVDQNYSNATSFLTGYRDFWQSFDPRDVDVDNDKKSNAKDARAVLRANAGLDTPSAGKTAAQIRADLAPAAEQNWFNWRMTEMAKGIRNGSELSSRARDMEKAGYTREAQWLREHDADYMTEAELESALAKAKEERDAKRATTKPDYSNTSGTNKATGYDPVHNPVGTFLYAVGEVVGRAIGAHSDREAEISKDVVKYDNAITAKREATVNQNHELRQLLEDYVNLEKLVGPENTGKEQHEQSGHVYEQQRLQTLRTRISALGYDPDTYIDTYREMADKGIIREIADAATSSRGAAALGTLATYAMTPLRGIGGAAATAASLLGGEIDPDDHVFFVNNLSSAIRTGVDQTFASKDLNWNVEMFGKKINAGSFLYNTINSAADSAVNMAVSLAVSKGLGAVGALSTAEQAQKWATGLTQLLMSSEVYTDELISAKRNGWSDGKAISWAATKGLIEAATEKYSIEAILKPSAGILRTLAKSFIAEGSEELAGNVLDTAADLIYNGNHAEIMQAYYEAINSGMSKDKAAQRALMGFMVDNAENFLAGGFSGLGMGAVGSGAQLVRDYKTGKSISVQGVTNDVLQSAVRLDLDGNTELAKRLADAQRRQSRQKSAGNVRLGQIARMGTKQAAKEQAQAYADAMAAQLEEQGYAPQTARSVAEAYVKLQTGEELTRSERKTAKRIEAEQGALESRRSAFNDALKSLPENAQAVAGSAIGATRMYGVAKVEGADGVLDAMVKKSGETFDEDTLRSMRSVVRDAVRAERVGQLYGTGSAVNQAQAAMGTDDTSDRVRQSLDRADAASRAGQQLGEHLYLGRQAEKTKQERREERAQEIADAVKNAGQVVLRTKDSVGIETTSGDNVTISRAELKLLGDRLSPGTRAMLDAAMALHSAQDVNAMRYHAPKEDEALVRYAAEYQSAYLKAERGDDRAEIRRVNPGLSDEALDSAILNGGRDAQTTVKVGATDVSGRASALRDFSPNPEMPRLHRMYSKEGLQAYLESDGATPRSFDAILRILGSLSREMGVSVVVVDRLGGREGDQSFAANGFYDRTGNAIYVSLESENPLLTTASHELWHLIADRFRKTKAADGTSGRDAMNARVNGYLKSAMGDEAYDAYLDRLRDRYSRSEVSEEAAANSMFDVLSDAGFVERLAAEEPALFEDMSDAIGEVLGTFAHQVQTMRPTSDTYPVYQALRKSVDNLRKIRDTFYAAKQKAAQLRRQQKSAPKKVVAGGEPPKDRKADERTKKAAPEEAEFTDEEFERLAWLREERDNIYNVGPEYFRRGSGERTTRDYVIKIVEEKKALEAKWQRWVDAQPLPSETSAVSELTARMGARKRAEDAARQAEEEAAWNAEEDDLPFSKQGEKKVAIGMTDDEREAILRNKSLEAAVYGGQTEGFVSANREDLESKRRSTIKSAYRKAIKEFELPDALYNDDIDVDLVVSNGTFDETSNKGTWSPSDIVRLIPVLEDAVRGAVGIEAHDNRYYADDSTVYFASLLGGYTDGEFFVPVRFGIKASTDGTNTLHVVVGDERIKKSEVISPTTQSEDLATGTRSDYKVSIARLAKKVKSKDIVKYLPDGLLSEAQKKVKWDAIAETIRYTNEKNDRKYAEYIRKGDLRSAERMVAAKAKQSGFSYVRTEDGLVAFSDDNNRIKSADPVTYDDDGNVIPLSERFNKKKTDIRFSRAGADSKTADKSMLRLAEDMEKQARPSEEIRQATGWYRSYDRNWSYEIDDSKMDVSFSGRYAEDGLIRLLARLDKRLMDGEITQEEWEKERRELGGDRAEFKPRRIGDIVRHDELFDAYPFLKNLSISFEDLGPKTLGEWRPWERTIALSKSIRGDLSTIKSVLIHEMQHAVQFYEGFSKGASPEYWDMQLRDGFDGRTEAQKQELEEAEKEYRAIYREDEQFVLDMTYLLDDMHPDVPRGEFDFDTWTQIEEDPQEWKDFDAERDRLAEKYGADKVYHFMNLYYHLKERRGQTGRNADQLYWNTAGEIEARDTQARLDLTAEERRAKRPDIDRQDVVFRWSKKSIENLTENDERQELQNCANGKYDNGSYIPLRRNTPSIFAYWVEKDSDGEATVPNAPIAANVGHIRQIMEEAAEETENFGDHRPHGIDEDAMIAAITGMDDPAYIVYQKNGRYAEVVSFYDGNRRRVIMSFDFGDYRYEQYLNGYPEGVYNTVVTIYSPDEFKKYLNGCRIVYDKQKSAKQVGSGSVIPVTHAEAPFAESIPHPDEDVNPYSKKSDAEAANEAYLRAFAQFKADPALRKAIRQVNRTLTELRNEIRKGDMELAAAKEQGKRTRGVPKTGEPVFGARARNQLDTLVNRWVREYKTSIPAGELYDRLEAVLSNLTEGEADTAAFSDATMYALWQIGYDVATHEQLEDMTEQRKAFRRAVREQKIYIDEQEKKELTEHFGSWKNFREQARKHGLSYTTTPGMQTGANSVDQLLGDEHSVLFDWTDGMFDLEYYTNGGEGPVPGATEFIQAIFDIADGVGASPVLDLDAEYDAWLAEENADLVELDRQNEASRFALDVVQGIAKYIEPTLADQLVKAKRENRALEGSLRRATETLVAESDRFERRAARERERAEKWKTLAYVRMTEDGLRLALRREVMSLHKKLVAPTPQAFVPDSLKEAGAAVVKIFTQNTSVFDQDQLRLVTTFYENLLKNDQSDDGTYNITASEDILDKLKTLSAVMEGRRIANLSLGELLDATSIVQHFNHLANTYGKTLRDGKWVSLAETNNAALEEMEKRGRQKKLKRGLSASDAARKAQSAVETFMVQEMIPDYFFERVGGEFERVWQDVNAGASRWGIDVAEAKSFLQSLEEEYGAKDWLRDKKENRVTIGLESGESIELTMDEIFGIYAAAKREQQNGGLTNHVLGGGIRFLRDVRATEEQNGKTVTGVKQEATAYRLTIGDLQNIQNQMSEKQIAFVDRAVEYLSTVMSEKANRTSLLECGFAKFTEKYYYPFHIDPATKDMSAEDAKSQNNYRMIKNYGMTKALTPGASNALIVENFSDVWSAHINEIAQYTNLSIPQQELRQLFNHKYAVVAEDGTREKSRVDKSRNMRAAIGNAYGSAYETYIQQLLKDMSGTVNSDPAGRFGEKLLSMFKSAAVMANMSVVIQQPSAILRALAEIDPKYFFTRSHAFEVGKQWDEMMRYSGTAVMKDIGGFELGTGKSMAGWMTGVTTGREKLNSAMSWGAERADKQTWVYLWNIVKKEVADKTGLKGEELLKAAGKRFDEVAAKTQVYDSKLNKSGFMRSQNGLTKLATAFMAEPTKSFNLLMDGVYKMRDATDKAGRVAGMKVLGRAVVAYAAASVLNELLQSIVGALRNKDEDRTLWEKYLANFSENLLTDLFIPSMLPYFRDVVSIFQGFDASRSDMEPVVVLKDAVESTMDALAGGGDWESAIVNDLDLIGRATGIPVKNLTRIYTSVRNVIAKTAYGVPEGQTNTRFKLTLKEALGDAMPKFLSEHFFEVFAYDRVVDEYVKAVGGDSEADARSKRYYDVLDSRLAVRGHADDGERSEYIANKFRDAVKNRMLSGEIDEDTALRLLTDYLHEGDASFLKILGWQAEKGDSKYAQFVRDASAYINGDYDALENAVGYLTDRGVGKTTAINGVKGIANKVKSCAQYRANGDEAMYEMVRQELIEDYNYDEAQLDADIARYGYLQPKEKSVPGYVSVFSTEDMADAYFSGNTSAYGRIREDLQKTGKTEAQLDSALKKEVQKRYEDGRLSKEQAVAWLTENLDVSVDEGATPQEKAKAQSDAAFIQMRKWETGEDAAGYTFGELSKAFVSSGASGDRSAMQKEIKLLLDHGIAASTISGWVTTTFKPMYLELYRKGDTAGMADMKSRIVTIWYYDLGYNESYNKRNTWNYEAKRVDDWLK